MDDSLRTDTATATVDHAATDPATPAPATPDPATPDPATPDPATDAPATDAPAVEGAGADGSATAGAATDGQAVAGPATTAGHDSPGPRPRLWRSRQDRMIGGVCGGAAQALGVDSTLLRVALVAVTLLGFGAGALIYLACWMIIPDE
jgi:phage shock protein PspC (stress-responsive transcriptional regulator)